MCKLPHHHHDRRIIFEFQITTQYTIYTAKYRVIETAGCQKSKCSSSWPPIIMFTCIVNIQGKVAANKQFVAHLSQNEQLWW